MRKISHILFFTALLLSSCSAQNRFANRSGKQLPDMHNAENSLDWTGTYVGMLPCARCQGVLTEIQIRPDLSYSLLEGFLGQNEKREEEGEFYWESDGMTIVLESNGRISKYQVQENQLRALNKNGKPLKARSGSYYLLKKQ